MSVGLTSIAKLGLVVALFAASVAVTPPRPQKTAANDDELLLNAQMLRFLCGGQAGVAADVGWLLLVQSVGGGSDATEVLHWAEAVTALEADYELAYYSGAVAALFDAKNTARVADLLKRAKMQYPKDYTYPMLQGLHAQMMVGDLSLAASAFAESLALGGPEYLRTLTAKLDGSASSCLQMQNLKLTGKNNIDPDALGVTKCIAMKLQSAVMRYRIEKSGAPKSIDDLVNAFDLGPIPTPPGRCWDILQKPPALTPCGDRP
jgi:hypothetical protein